MRTYAPVVPRRPLLLAALLTGLARASAAGDIYVWHDVGGGEHYTTSLDGVPEDRRGTATLFVRERPRAAPEPTPTAEPSPAAPRTDDETIEDRVVRAFAAGVEAASQAAADDAEIVPATIVQTTEVVVEPAERDTLIVGGFVPGARGRRPRGPRPEIPDEEPSFVGPAGPPPIGAAGPAPVGRVIDPRR
jgi:hypothetical protein